MSPLGSTTVLELWLTAFVGLSIPLPAQAPPVQRLSRADVFIRTFGPSPNSQALRTSLLEQEEQVRLAFYGIDATRAQVASGKKSQEEGDLIIDGFEQTIRNYVHDKSNDGLVRAGSGQASDISAIAKDLGGRRRNGC